MKTIHGFSNYIIDELGNVKHKRSRVNRFRKFVLDHGYRRIGLVDDTGTSRFRSQHRLLMETFRPVEGMEFLVVNHIDGDRLNNNLDNLEWCTRDDNMEHRARHDEIGSFVLTNEQVRQIRELTHLPRVEVAEMFGVAPCTISQIVHGHRRYHVE